MEVANNSREHADHEITGNAVRQAITKLRSNFGFSRVSTTWYTIYNPIAPKRGYTRIDDNISSQSTLKANLNKACWETEYMNKANIKFYWVAFPTTPASYEAVVERDY